MRGDDDAAVAPDEAEVSSTFAQRFGVHAGAAISVPAPRGDVTLRVARVVENPADPAGTIIVSRGTIAHQYGDTQVDDLAVMILPGEDRVHARAQIVSALSANPALVRSTYELRREVDRMFAPIVALSGAIVGLTLFTAFAVAATTLSAVVLERRRDLGLLRTVGATRTTIRNCVLLEAAFVALIAAVLGLAGGTAAAASDLELMNRVFFGSTFRVAVPARMIGSIIASCTVATVLAGIVPARMASRISTDAARRRA